MAHMPMSLQLTSCALRATCLHQWGFAPVAYRRTSVLAQLSLKTNATSTISPRSFSTAVKVSGLSKCGVDTCSQCSSRVYGSGIGVRWYSSPSSKPKSSSSQDGALQEASQSRGGAVTLSTAEKVKENVKTVSYGGVIIVGVLIGGAMLYYVLNELFASDSPNNIYSHAFKMCKLSTEVQDTLGTPIKCYGEETRRGWRRHVAFQEFLAGETRFLRMRFYIEGQFKKGTVNVEKKMNDKGKYEYTYISVDVDGYPPRRIEVPF